MTAQSWRPPAVFRLFVTRVTTSSLADERERHGAGDRIQAHTERPSSQNQANRTRVPRTEMRHRIEQVQPKGNVPLPHACQIPEGTGPGRILIERSDA